MRLRPDLVLLPLDHALVVFSEDAQYLVGLNPAAAFVVRALQRGTPVSELTQAFSSEGLAAPEEAERWVTTALDHLVAHGLLADGTSPTALPMEAGDSDHPIPSRQIAWPYAPFEPVAERRYRLLETCVLIRFAHPAQVRLVESVIGHLATDNDTMPSFILEIQAVMLRDNQIRSNVYRDRMGIETAPRLSYLGPVVKAVLWEAAVGAHDFLFYIHAGVVGAGESCILLPAAAGSGKSSLTAALTHAGFRYFSDEVALIDRTTFRVPPVPLAICVKDTGWDLMIRYHPTSRRFPSIGDATKKSCGTSHPLPVWRSSRRRRSAISSSRATTRTRRTSCSPWRGRTL